MNIKIKVMNIIKEFYKGRTKYADAFSYEFVIEFAEHCAKKAVKEERKRVAKKKKTNAAWDKFESLSWGLPYLPHCNTYVPFPYLPTITEIEKPEEKNPVIKYIFLGDILEL